MFSNKQRIFGKPEKDQRSSLQKVCPPHEFRKQQISYFFHKFPENHYTFLKFMFHKEFLAADTDLIKYKKSGTWNPRPPFLERAVAGRKDR